VKISANSLERGKKFFKFFQSRFLPGLAMTAILPFSGTCQQDWKEVWSDHFSGKSLDTKNWKFETGTGESGWGNNEFQYYTGETSNLQVSAGELRIIARKEEKDGKQFTSARIKSQDLQSFQYGRIEASIKLPWGKGIWPAFWMLGQNHAQIGWPKCGEIDIMEHVNELPELNGTIHWDSSGRKYHGGTTVLPNRDKFHLYAVEWDENKIVWTLDGNAYWTEDISQKVPSRNEFHHPFYLLFNLAVGGDWPGSPDSTSIFPDTMHVDFVRVLKKQITGRKSKNPVKKNKRNQPGKKESQTGEAIRNEQELRSKS